MRRLSPHETAVHPSDYYAHRTKVREIRLVDQVTAGDAITFGEYVSKSSAASTGSAEYRAWLDRATARLERQP